MTLLVAPADLAPLLSGQPVLIALADLPGAVALELPGLALWLARAEGASVVLARPGAKPGPATRRLPGVPGPVLGLVAPSAAAAGPVLAAWEALGPQPPELLLAPDGAAALPALAARAVAMLSEIARETARLHRGLVATRRDYEATREVVMALEQSIGHEIPPAPSLVLSLEPGLGLAVGATGGRLALGQVLHQPVDALCAVALHLAEARLGPGARLRVRLYGVESGTVFGAWVLGGEALAPGWLQLDLAAPLGPRRETAALDILAELSPGEALAFSLEDAVAAPAQAVQLSGGGQGQRRALALRAWTAPQGRRFQLPAGWDFEQFDLPLTPEGVPVLLPAQLWDLGRIALGPGGMESDGGGAPRPWLRPVPGAEAMALLPAVPVTGLDLLEASLTLRAGSGEGLEAALWLQPAPGTAAAPEELDLAAPGARCSGWRRLAPGSDRLSIALRLPPGAPPMLAVALVLRRAGKASGALALEWSELVGRRLGRVELPAAPPGPAAEATPVAPAPVTPAPAAAPDFASARLVEHYATPDGGYRHLDLLVEQLRDGGHRWRLLRFKLALNGAVPQLEFRRNPDWPVMFEHWPGERRDDHGPLFLVPEDRAAAIAGAMRSAQDARAVRLLLRLLPRIVAAAQLPPSVGDLSLWRSLAERMAAAERVAA
jgi:hypothetical protein